MNFKYVNVNERDITFKSLHNILTTKNRLFQIKKINSPLCLLCNSIENQLHMFVEYKKIKNVLLYFKDLLNKICSIKNHDITKILHLNFKANKRQSNTAILLTTAYIKCVWYNRSQTTYLEIQVYKTRILKQHHLLEMILRGNMTKFLTENYYKLLEYI